jgi:hypothetical protein
MAWTPEFYVDVPPGCILVRGGSDHVVDRGGVPIFLSDSVEGIFAPSCIDNELVTAGDPGPSTAEFHLASRENFF